MYKVYNSYVLTPLHCDYSQESRCSRVRSFLSGHRGDLLPNGHGTPKPHDLAGK